ncbi:hypothetical protein NTE04_003984 [Vibrio mimicus]|nr:hypothetical protein [Vibrio cholerae]
MALNVCLSDAFA